MDADRIAYLDNAASTPLCPEAVEAMAPLHRELYANPTGAHRMARDTRRRIDDARDVMAEALGSKPGEIVFTGGGTEGDNLAVVRLPSAGGRDHGVLGHRAPRRARAGGAPGRPGGGGGRRRG